LIEKALVFPRVMARVDQSTLDHELAPEVVAVTGEQGMVEVEDCKVHQGSRPKLGKFAELAAAVEE
jgi:hypothetical protein